MHKYTYMCLYIHIHVYIYIYTCTLYLSYLFVLWLLINTSIKYTSGLWPLPFFAVISLHLAFAFRRNETRQISFCNLLELAKKYPFEKKWSQGGHCREQEVNLWGGFPKSSILTGFSIINRPFLGTPILETPICCILCSIGTFCLHWNTLRTYIWVQLESEHMMCHLAVDVMLPPVFSMRSGFDLVMIYGHRGMWWSRWEVLVVAFKQKATWHDPSPLSLC